jgi:hypothetical protein
MSLNIDTSTLGQIGPPQPHLPCWLAVSLVLDASTLGLSLRQDQVVGRHIQPAA